MINRLKASTNVSLGYLRGVGKFPDDGLPDWANLIGKRMVDMGVSDIPAIRRTIEAMEIERRAKFRASFANFVPVTEFDEYLEDMCNKFYMRDVK